MMLMTTINNNQEADGKVDKRNQSILSRMEKLKKKRSQGLMQRRVGKNEEKKEEVKIMDIPEQ